MVSHQDENIFLVQIFFYCLDHVSRPVKHCPGYSGKLEHASVVDSVSKLSLKMDGKPTNFSWESCFMSYPNQAFSWKIKVTVTIFGQSCLIEKITTRFSVTQSTSSLFYSKRMYQETYGKLLALLKPKQLFPGDGSTFSLSFFQNSLYASTCRGRSINQVTQKINVFLS